MQPNMRMIQEMQQRLQKAQDDLAHTIVEGTAGGGMVTVRVTGHKTVESIAIAPEAVDPAEVELLEDLILAAINDAMAKAEKAAAEAMSAVTGGIKIPGLT